MNTLRSKIMLGVLSLSLVGLGWAAPRATYAAEAKVQPVVSAGVYQDQPDQLRNLRLEHRFKQEQLLLAIQATRIELAREVAAEAQARIVYLKSEGQDVATLEAALAAFYTQLQAAQDSWNATQAVINGHAGFDANGKVLDAEQAGQTVRQVGDGLRTTARTLRDAGVELRRAERDFRRSLRSSDNM